MFSPYTLGFIHGGMRDNLIYCVYLKRELELLQGFDSLPSHLARIKCGGVLFMCDFAIF